MGIDRYRSARVSGAIKPAERRFTRGVRTRADLGKLGAQSMTIFRFSYMG